MVGAGLDLFDRQVSFHGQNPQSVTFDGSLQSQKIFEFWPGVSDHYTINAALGRKLKIGIVQRGKY